MPGERERWRSEFARDDPVSSAGRGDSRRAIQGFRGGVPAKGEQVCVLAGIRLFQGFLNLGNDGIASNSELFNRRFRRGRSAMAGHGDKDAIPADIAVPTLSCRGFYSQFSRRFAEDSLPPSPLPLFEQLDARHRDDAVAGALGSQPVVRLLGDSNHRAGCNFRDNRRSGGFSQNISPPGAWIRILEFLRTRAGGCRKVDHERIEEHQIGGFDIRIHAKLRSLGSRLDLCAISSFEGRHPLLCS